ncbi:MAG TPA: hypothetical protein VHB25_18360 [Gemmatimonadaceae bacterium]|nr:hypothetical protein [Gemmatimonadaceae bacterium]
MRSVLTRLSVLAAGVLIVASCDTATPTTGTFPTSGSSGSSSNQAGGTKPTIAIDSPLVGTLINVGDSVLVTVHLHDAKALTSASMFGVTEKGSIDLGTFTQTLRYGQIDIPDKANFRPGLRDTVIRRYLQPLNPADTTLDSLIVIVVARDSLGLADTAQTRINIVAGPKVSIPSPANGDSVPAGVGLAVSGRAQSDIGVGRIDIRVRGESNWPTPFDTTITQVYTSNPRDITYTGVVRVPINAPLRGRLTITATAVDANRQPGASSPVVVFVRASSAAQPRVTQSVSPKSEYLDSVTVNATGDAIAKLGLIIRDSAGTIVQQDTLNLTPPFNANVQANIGLGLPSTEQGHKLGITAFAVDQAGRVGYAVPINHPASEGSVANALIDSTLIVYGRTYQLPQSGNIGDIAVDQTRGNVFLSNTDFNLLDVWQSTPKAFSSNTVSVGSLPWGLFVSNNPDTLLVANSGGTNISRVFIGSTDVSQMHDDLANRILTRNTYVYTVTVQKDDNTGKIRLTADGPISYSDRPQYLVQSKGGRIFYSTRPTATNPAGTIRWLDPTLPVPDPRQIWQYGTYLKTTTQQYALFNVDSIAIGATLPSSLRSDTLFIWDHPYGQKTGLVAVFDTVPVNALAQAVAGGSDAEMVLRLDVSTLPLEDTTFASASGDRSWVAFGEAHTTGAGRVIMVADSTGVVPNFFSPLVTISDLTDNASEKIFGIGQDRSGLIVGAHGSQTYFSAVDDPFHLRLQGKYDSPDDGAGIAFHPNADGVLTPQGSRVAFAAEASGSIDAIDIAYYINRGHYLLKNPIYGPLRASLPMPGDPPNVILKLFALSKQGLVVIDLTQADLKPGP